jgi:rubrerythrin
LTDTRIESDSALAEVTQDPSSRKKFLKMMGGTGATGALALVVAACGSSSSSSSSSTKSTSTAKMPSGSAANKSDLEIVNYALTLEYLEAAFYKKVIASGLFKGAQLNAIKTFGDQEQQHVEALTATAKKLGTPAKMPTFKFPIKNAKSTVKLAATVENLGAAAYLGQAGRIKSKEILAAALSIHSVEARHAAALNLMLGKDVTPNGGFAKPASMAQVLPAVKPFIVA